jgi:hypothetical protein
VAADKAAAISTPGTSRAGDDRPVPLTRWQDWVSAGVVTLVGAALVITDLTDTGFRDWWTGHALTTDVVAGLLVLLITLLVADQVVRMRQTRDRSQAVAAQAAIMMTQARRSSRAVKAILDGSGDRDAATDELRTYMIMLMVGAPVLIDARLPRKFLEQAQHLAAEMARSLSTAAAPAGAPGRRRAGLDDAIHRLRAASAPLLQQLSADQLAAVSGDDAD